ATAAAVTLGLFLLAAIFPAIRWFAYLAVGGGIVGVTAMGAGRPRDPTFGRVVDVGKSLVGQVWKRKDGWKGGMTRIVWLALALLAASCVVDAPIEVAAGVTFVLPART